MIAAPERFSRRNGPPGRSSSFVVSPPPPHPHRPLCPHRPHGPLLPAILSAALLLLSLPACSPSSSPPPPDQTLRFTTARLSGFDPARASDEATSLATGKLYEGLLQYAYFDRPYRLEPLLASSMPSVSPDGLVWTFSIRTNVCFADDPCFPSGKGRPISASDFVYSFLRIADVKTASPGYWLFRGKILGLDDFRAASADLSRPTDFDHPPAGLSAPDPSTLVIRLTTPYPQLSWALAMPYAFAVPREAVEFYGSDFPLHPVGTGPYVLASARPNYRYEYRANPKWAETGRSDSVPPDAPTPDAGRPLPLAPRIVDSVVSDPSTAWLMFLSGALDRISLSLDQWDSVLDPAGNLRPAIADRGVTLRSAPQLSVSYTAFNMDDPVLGPNKKLRQALVSAFDSGEWLRFHKGRVQIPNSPLPPSILGAPSTPHPYAFDLDRARRLLAEAGYPDGRDPATGRRLSLTLDIGSADNTEARQAAELMVAFFDRIGVRLELSFNNWPAFLKKIERRQTQLFTLTWIGDYPDAQNFLQLFYSKNVSPGPNRANYVSPEFDALYERIVALPPDSPERAALCERAVDVVREDCPWICMGWPRAYILRSPRLRNDLPHDFSHSSAKYLSPTP